MANKKVKFLGSIILGFSILMGNAYATLEEDLTNAIEKSDLMGMESALKQGANPNIFVCSSTSLRALKYEANLEKCSPDGGDSHTSLIWKISGDSTKKEVMLEIVRILTKAGARTSIRGIDRKTGSLHETKDYGLLNVFTDYKNGVEIAFEYIDAGYIPKKGEVIRNEEQREIYRKFFESVNPEKFKRMNDLDSRLKTHNLSKAYCNQQFDRAKTLQDFEEFINKYKNNDICNLITLSNDIVSKEKLRLTEQAKADAAAEERRLKIEAKIDEEVFKLRQAQQAKEKKQVIAFRKSISIGDQTNCGLAIEIKGKLVKVAFAVANYGNEHWIRRDQIFPSGFGCSFYNGQYQPQD